MLAVVLIVFIYQPVKVEGTSMMPGLTDQERIFINKYTYKLGAGSIARDDLVVFHYPGDPSQSYIKRIIGLPGDTVEILDGAVWINGQSSMNPTCRRNIATTSRSRNKSFRGNIISCWAITGARPTTAACGVSWIAGRSTAKRFSYTGRRIRSVASGNGARQRRLNSQAISDNTALISRQVTIGK